MPDEKKSDIDGTGTPSTDGPIEVPIMITTDNTGTITQLKTVNVTISLPAPDATAPITLEYLENNNAVTVANMPTASWSSGTATFQVVIDQTLLSALSSRTTTLTVLVTSGNGVGQLNLSIAIP